MLYLLAFIGAVTLAVLLWKAFGPGVRPQSGRASARTTIPNSCGRSIAKCTGAARTAPASPDGQDTGD